MKTTNWRPLKKMARKTGPVWIVVRRKYGQIQRGFFKYTSHRSRLLIGNSVAHELVSYHLARLLRLNVARVETAVIGGKRGIVSIAKPVPARISWNRLQHRLSGSLIRRLHRPEQLLRTFLFDVWICNIDRHGGNLITYRKGNRYDFYMIDHGIALLSAAKWRRVPWTSAYWLNLSRYNRKYPRGLRAYIRSFVQLQPYLAEIERIPAHTIRRTVNRSPAVLLSASEKKALIQLLLYRQRYLRSIIRNWCIRHKKRVGVHAGKKGLTEGKQVNAAAPVTTELNPDVPHPPPQSAPE
jgi:hypothetical protein